MALWVVASCGLLALWDLRMRFLSEETPELLQTHEPQKSHFKLQISKRETENASPPDRRPCTDELRPFKRSKLNTWYKTNSTFDPALANAKSETGALQDYEDVRGRRLTVRLRGFLRPAHCLLLGEASASFGSPIKFGSLFLGDQYTVNWCLMPSTG